LGADTLQLLKDKMKIFIEDILGLKNIQEQTDSKIDGIIHLLMKIRKEARQRKDYVTSDKIRNELAALGVQLKDEKDGSMSYAFI
jgi:cysteinyl-tRNA synthetase